MDTTPPPPVAPATVIIRLAERANMSVRELALRAGMNEKTLRCRLARGGSFLASELAYVADVLGVRTCDLFNDEQLLAH